MQTCMRPGDRTDQETQIMAIKDAILPNKQFHTKPGRSIRPFLGRSLLVAGLALSLWAPLAPFSPAQAKGPDSLADLAESVSDAVVNISASQAAPERRQATTPNIPQGTPFDDLFDEFFKRRQQEDGGNNAPPQQRRGGGGNSLGSGFVIDSSGIVITNNHVIADATEITVIFTDGQRLKAELIGKDPKVDVAVLRVKPEKPLKAVKFGNSNKARVGDWVLAVGNPFGLGGTVTAGIVSARNRNINSGPYDNYIQTDASINKGNSGGPLFNMDGEVIGINTAILSPSGGSVGIGFATPAATVMPIIDQLQKYGEARRGWLGVRIQSVDDDVAESLGLGKARGALIGDVDEKGPAKKAGLKPGDVIVKFDGQDVKDSADLPKIVAGTPVGKDSVVTIYRDGKPVDLNVTIGLLEDNVKQAALETGKPPQSPTQNAIQKALGMEFAGMSADLRKRYNIKSEVDGAVVTKVDANSVAADKRIQVGDIILEINQEPIKQALDVTAKMKAFKEAGRKTALFLIANAAGDKRFVALPID